MIPPDVCYNGCCQSNPCMNKATCIEKCQTFKDKFECQCPPNFMGKYCERNLTYSACLDIAKNSNQLPKSGVYEIVRSDNGIIFPVYCTFELNKAWTLIESFSLDNINKFQNLTFNTHGFSNIKPPFWENYRIGIWRIKYVHSKSTLFAATCDFPKRTGRSLIPDFLLGSLKDVDFITETSINGCRKYMKIDIRGRKCSNCTAYTVYGGAESYHFHIDMNDKSSSALCDLKPFEGGLHEYFGYYKSPNSEFLCTTTHESTTQWWLGQEY